MTMLDSRSTGESLASPVIKLPEAGPEFASITNPAYIRLLNESTEQYRTAYPDETRPFIIIAGAIDRLISEALREGEASELPFVAARMALNAARQPNLF